MFEPTIGDAPTIAGDSTGTMLAGRYRVVRQLGSGGMGSVWLVEDVKLDNKQFAVKMLPSILVSNRRAYEQVKREALIALKLVHPNIVQIRALEEATEGGNPFLVMDYIDGQTLDEYLAEKGKLPADETVRLLTPVAAALDYAHGEGVVHRDVKPGNVMIRKDGHPFILDFGIAREIQETMTRVTGKLSSGTLTYMSPEQLHGAVPKPAQDIYSFAAMAYECLTGAPPFSRGQIEYQIDHDAPAPLPPGGPRSCAAAVMAGLAKKPEDRPPTCAAVLEGHEAGGSRLSRPDDSLLGRARSPSGPQSVAPRPPAPPAPDAAEAQRIREQITARVLRADELYQKLAPFRRDPEGLEAHLQTADDNWAVVKAASVHAGTVDQALLTRTSSALASLEREFLWLQEAASVRKDCHAVQERIKILEADLLSELGEHLRADARYVAAQKQVEASASLMQKGNFAAAWASFQKAERAVKAAAEAVRARRANERAASIKCLDEIMARVGNRAEQEAENLKDDPDYQKGCAQSEEAVRLFDAGDFNGASRTYRAMAECFEKALARLEKARQEKMRALEAEVQALEDEVQAREKKLTRFPKVSWPPSFDRRKISDLERQAALARGKGDYKQATETLRKCCDVLSEAYRLAVKKQLANVQFRAEQLAAALAEKPDDSEEAKTLLVQARERHATIAAASTAGATDGGDAVLHQAEQALVAIQDILEQIKDIRAVPSVTPQQSEPQAPEAEQPSVESAQSPESANMGSRRFGGLWKTVLAVILLVLVAVGGGVWYYQRDPEQQREKEDAAELAEQETTAEEAARQKAATEEAKHKAEKEARQKVVAEEAKRKAEEAARQKAAAEEAKRKAEEAARQKAAAEEAKRKAEEIARQKAETEEKRNAAEKALAALREAGAEKYGRVSFGRIVAQYAAGTNAFAAASYADAATSFDDVCAAAPECEKASAERRKIEDVDDIRNKAFAAQQKVLEAGGNKRFVKAWDEAVAALKSGHAKFVDHDFDRAKSDFEKSLELFAVFDNCLSLPQNPQHGQECALMLPGGEKIAMIYVAPGEFMMGSEDGDDDEKPVHKVTLTKGYWLGKYEVTQRQWESVMGANPSGFMGDDRPVENVSWEDCQEFIRRVNDAAAQQFGGAVRLPTEAEWEYACRAESTSSYAGNGNLDDMGWYDGNSGGETHSVGQKQANAWGFHDMHGNVWEWCNDWYCGYNGDTTDPTGPASGDDRVLRGGGWRDGARLCRSAYRNVVNPGSRFNFYGFRLCCSAGPRGGAELGGRVTETPPTRSGRRPARAGEHGKVQLWEGGPYWAETNIGAEKPEDYGYYFWWGDTVGYKRENGQWVASDGSKEGFVFRRNVPTCDKSISVLKEEGWITAENILAPEHDAARVHWGGAWRMPTKQEMYDLNRQCDWTFTTQNGVKGYVVRGRGAYAAASIFLPCAGYGGGTSLYSAGSYGDYWSSVPRSDYSYDAWGLYFYSSGLDAGRSSRRRGQPVRPVQGFTK